jgi:hypothetical protein
MRRIALCVALSLAGSDACSSDQAKSGGTDAARPQGSDASTGGNTDAARPAPDAAVTAVDAGTTPDTARAEVAMTTDAGGARADAPGATDARWGAEAIVRSDAILPAASPYVYFGSANEIRIYQLDLATSGCPPAARPTGWRTRRSSRATSCSCRAWA